MLTGFATPNSPATPSLPKAVKTPAASRLIGGIKYAKVAAYFGVSWIIARQWFHDGCPEDDYESVALWIVGNVTRQLSPDENGWRLLDEACGSREAAIAFIGFEPPIGAFVRQVESDSSDGLEDVDVSAEVDADRTVSYAALDEIIKLALSDVSIEGCLKRTLMIEEKIFRDSMHRADPKNLAAYKAICGLRLELETKVQEVINARDSLVPVDLVINASATVVSIVLNEIRALPEAAAARVNPANPSLAKEELEVIITQLVTSANRQAEAQLKELERVKLIPL